MPPKWITVCEKRRFKTLLESRLGFWCEAGWDLIFARARVAKAAPRSGLQAPYARAPDQGFMRRYGD